MSKKIYLSAAAHAIDNKTKCPISCSENTHCNEYMDVVETRLREVGFEVIRGDKNLTGSQAMTTRVAQANKAKVDLYYVAHTNAGGGRYSMTMHYPNAASKTKAEVFHKYRKSMNHKVKARSDLYEINMTSMICLYDELFFHDNAQDCAWFHNGGMKTMAEEAVQAICEICGVQYKRHVDESKPEKPVLTTHKAGDQVQLKNGRLYATAKGNKFYIRTGTFYLYDGVKVGNRYRVTNNKGRVNKAPIWANVSGWVEI